MKAMLLAVLVSAVLAGRAGAQSDTITILHLNDTHSTLSTIGPRDGTLKGAYGSIARAATLIGMTRMEDPNTLVLHAGDVSIGDLFYTKYLAVAELRLLGALGVDAVTLGNHEFDLGPLYFEQMLDSAFVGGAIPLLSANAVLDDPGVTGLKKYVGHRLIKHIGSAKVGIFGLTTPATNLISNPAPVFFDTNFVAIAAEEVDSLRAQGCTAVICLSHLGVVYDRLLAGYVPGIDLIVGGHDHFAFDKPVAAITPTGDTTWIVQADAFYKHMGKVRLQVQGGKTRLLESTLITVDRSIPEEPTIAAAVDELISGIEGTYGPLCTQPVAVVESYFEEVADSLTSKGWRDTPIGNLVADVYRQTLGTQIAIEAGGSTAHPLYPGPIVAADVFRVVGYGFNEVNGLGFNLATFSINGADLVAGLEWGVSDLSSVDDFFIQVSGMTYAYDPSLPVYNRITNVTVGGQPLNPAATYTVASNTFTPLILGSIGIPFSDLYVCGGDTTEFQTLLAGIISAGTLRPYVDGRVKADITTAIRYEPAAPVAYTLEQNYPNPFNPSTKIGYRVSGLGSSWVKLSVYDMLGREVAVLVNQQNPAGNYSVTWNASGMASGVYYYRIAAGSFVDSKRMILVK